ncbi:putative bifunctional diguanylate cyclase/phosphodiesterase [Vibrio cholerae]|uniref:putative bifunctional diguanylate cyclase/phosphodiesterase n=1 Tax=Vibrio cholerae TaxID=666 RepID=UPI00201A31F1|nr:phosphodiesterase [Vibrio cholerae]EJI2329878.1 EAL domain-containing protein [Vibrio cholerae]ELK6277237.1 EAL domain-containing protein [Vibrio cholerae]MCL5753430.1 phosphodiesterase [Vibrio cholerae]
MKILHRHQRSLLFFALICLVLTASYLWFHDYPTNKSVFVTLLLVPLVVGTLVYGLIGALISGLVVFLVFYWLAQGHDVTLSYWFRFAVFVVITLVIAIFIQVQSHYERHITYLLNHDPGTKLPSRMALWNAIDHQLDQHSMVLSPNGLAVISIDNLHDISITFNHDVADELLVTLWQRIVEVFYPGAKAYHYHRERLAVLFHNPENNLDTLVRKLALILEESVDYNDIPIHFTARVGYVEIDSNSRGKRTLINEAETALFEAKEQDKQLVIFTSRMRLEKRNALAILGSVYKAMQSGELTLYYQPKIDLQSTKLIGFEALARWQHNKLGTLSPAEFIPLIENTEIIHNFTAWAIELALKTLKHWQSLGREYHVAVNISSHNLMDADFSLKVRQLLEKYNLPSSLLELEITESEIMKNPEQSVRVLEELADIPIVISIDDFGTGYSSLAYLNRLPATIIKIDRTIISQVDVDENVKKIVSSTINLAHSLGMKVIAEGIETESQKNMLQELGCDIGQGYLFSAAMPKSEAQGWKWQ